MTGIRLTLVLALAATLLIPARLLPTEEDNIKSKQAELTKLREEIEQYEEKIKEHEKKEHATLELLDTYDRQETLLRKLVGELRKEERTLQGNIDDTKRSIQELGGQVSYLKRNYASYVSNVYRYGRTYDLELLLTSKSLNQVLVRAEYLRRFSDQRKKDLDKITTKCEAIEEENLKLQRQLVEQRQLITDKAAEEKKLQDQMKKRKKMLATIRRDKKMLRQDADRTLAAAQELEQLISKLIEQERIRKAREAARAKEGKAPPPSIAPSGQAFVDRRGHLRWPVSQGRIVTRFGNQQHPVLKTITQNTGIDIAVPTGTDVEAVANAEVSAISWLPSFGNLVILDHSNGYRTVYAHLSEIAVSEGEQVTEGNVIGKSGESFSGSVLHFEIWKDREKQDPEHWLSPRGLTKR
ncbi:MAG: peptidoglycan DD-metalloendopeptidase family protein [Bacteroidota bacterium]|jgi:septal ring factor EnvC (AmiA/AmiB activator)